MRFTLETTGDVEVPDGSTVAACRAGLVALTGIDALATAALGVDGYLLEEGQVAGAEPWVPGAVMRIGAPQGVPTPDPARAALIAPWHLAVLSGPDAGLVAVPGGDETVHIGRSGSGAGTGADRLPGSLALEDPAVSVRHARIRRVGRRWVVDDLGSANGTRTVPVRTRRGCPERAGTRPVGRGAGRRLVPGQEVHVGSTVLVVRLLATDVTTGGSGQADPPQRLPRVPTATWLLPALVSVALALVLRTVVPLLFALTAVVPALSGLRRGQRPAQGSAIWHWPDLAASAIRGTGCAGERVDVGSAPRGPLPPGAGPATDPWWSALHEGVAVTGNRDAALAVARALVGAAIAEPDVGLAFALGSHAQADWSWCRWVEHRASGSGARTLLVADGADRSTLDRWSVSRSDGAGVLVVVSDPAEVPAWCEWTIDGAGRRQRRGAEPEPTRGRDHMAPAAGPGWADTQSRRVAARDQRMRRATALLPDRIGLVELGVPTDPRSVAGHWSGQSGPMTSLFARICVDATGPATLDLLADGPHALIAGTTGAGKSALLQSLVLDLALRYPPDRLAVVLVDFKGGAGLGPCRRLPHVVGEVTDLDAVLAARAVDGLRREMGRREHLFRDAGVADLEALRSLGPAPPRILVVVDELRALRDDLPDVLPALIRLAAQGRSLGIHLVLATQRPAGAVDAQVRANVALRICLRVTDPADSLDVVDVPDAAGLPADRPGRAVIRRGHAAPVVEQTAWAALGAAATTARWAPAWPTTGDGAGTCDDRQAGRRPAADLVPGLVEAARQAAVGHSAPVPLWSPLLPPSVDDSDLPPPVDGTGGLVFGLADRPDLRAAVAAGWEPADGALLVVGRPGSGRTTTLRAVTRSARRAGLTVHLLHGRPLQAGDVGATSAAPSAADGSWGTLVDVTDPRRILRLLHLLRTQATHGAVEHLLVVDDVGGVLRVLESGRAGPGAETFSDLLRDAARLGIGVVAAGSPAEVLRLAPHAATRLVLATGDAHDDAALGVPREMSARSGPGRAVLLPGARSVQVSVGPGREHDDAATDDACHGDHRGSPVAQDQAPAPSPPRGLLRLEPIPLEVVLTPFDLSDSAEGDASAPSGVTSDGPRSADPPRIVLGRGGDDAGLVAVSIRTGLLVLGPPRSGRTTTLETIRAALTSPERRADAPPSEPTSGTGPRRRTGREVLALVDLVPPGAGRPTTRGAEPGGDAEARLRAWWASRCDLPDTPVLLVDDLDRVLRTCPGLDELLTGWIESLEAGERAPVIVAAVSTHSAAATYRGAIAALRRGAPVLVLAPSTPGSTEAAGRSALEAADPAFPRHPGRGALLIEDGPIPLQVGRAVGSAGPAV